MMKDKLVNWLTKTMVSGQKLDEYQTQEINYILKFGYIIFYWYLTLTFVLGVFLFNILPIRTLFFGLLLGNLLILLIVGTLVTQMVKKRQLDLVEAYDQNDYKHLIHKLKISSVRMGIFFFVFERLGTILINWGTKTAHQSFTQILMDPENNLMCIISSIIFGVCMYYVRRNKIKK